MTTKYDLNGRKAIVTGAAKGIGRAVAERFLKSGASVGIWDRDGATLAATAEELSKLGPVHPCVLDVSHSHEVEGGVTDAIDHWGGIDILVTCAGILGQVCPTPDYPEDEWHRVIEIHLTGTFLCARAASRHMLEQGYGRIVTLSSDSGKEGTANMPAYSAAKAGIIGLTRGMAREFATRGVTVNSISPTIIDTEMGREAAKNFGEKALSRIPMKRYGQPEEIAAMIAWLCSEEASFTSGTIFDATGGRSHY
jgi:3-oxoacyl-[acyl-carrier protein] reductase